MAGKLIAQRHAGIACVVVVVWALAPRQAAQSRTPVLHDPNIPNGEVSVYRLTARDGSLSTSTHRVSAEVSAQGPVYVVVTETKKMVLMRQDLTPVSIDRVTAEGELLWRVRYRPDRAVFIYPGPTRNKVEKVDENRYDVNAITHIVRGFPFDAANEVSFDLVVPDSSVGVSLHYVNDERITVPAGTFECAVLSAGVSGIKGRLYTKKVRFWVERNQPHRLILQEDEGITDTQRTELVESYVAPARKTP